MLLGAWPRFGSSRGSRSRSGDGRSRTQFTNRPTPITNTIEAVKMEGRVLLTLLFMLHSALCALRVNSSVDVKIYSYVQGDTSRCAKPPVAFKTKRFGLAWHIRPGQNRLFVLKSTGGFAQRDVSPCMYLVISNSLTGFREISEWIQLRGRAPRRHLP